LHSSNGNPTAAQLNTNDDEDEIGDADEEEGEDDAMEDEHDAPIPVNAQAYALAPDTPAVQRAAAGYANVLTFNIIIVHS
jgi:hypothetical protein